MEVGGGYSPKSQEKAATRAERTLDLPQDIVSVIHSMDSVLAFGPSKARVKPQRD